MYKTVVVNFIGAPGVGKSLCAALLFAELKSLHYTCEYVQEYAKSLVWQERFDELNNQWMVSLEQYRMLKAVDGKVKYIINDSPLLLGAYYNKYNLLNVCNIEKTREMIHSKMEEFDNVYILIERNEQFPYEIAGRVQSEDESFGVQIELKEMLRELGVEYLSVKSCKENVGCIIDYILGDNEKNI